MTFRFDKLTTKAQEALAAAQSAATSRDNPEISTLHLLAELLHESDGIVRPLLEKIGAPVDQLQ
ncbi:MAG: Clp protease N-terminal domain-containing protein, partial [Pirellulaceae bacterium]